MFCPLTQTPGAPRSGTARPPVFFPARRVMKKRSILVIDDDLIWHRLIARFLDGTGYKIYTAATCADGVKLAALHRPDCIILDFHLTDGDALCVCSAIKVDEELKKIPVIIFSSDPCAEITAYAQCQANYFLLKGTAALAALPAAIAEMLPPALSVQSDG